MVTVKKQLWTNKEIRYFKDKYLYGNSYFKNDQTSNKV